MWFVVVVVFVLVFLVLNVKPPDNPFPFYQLKLGFPSEALWLQQIHNEALSLGLTVDRLSVCACGWPREHREPAGSSQTLPVWWQV